MLLTYIIMFGACSSDPLLENTVENTEDQFRTIPITLSLNPETRANANHTYTVPNWLVNSSPLATPNYKPFVINNGWWDAIHNKTDSIYLESRLTLPMQNKIISNPIPVMKLSIEQLLQPINTSLTIPELYTGENPKIEFFIHSVITDKSAVNVLNFIDGFDIIGLLSPDDLNVKLYDTFNFSFDSYICTNEKQGEHGVTTLDDYNNRLIFCQDNHNFFEEFDLLKNDGTPNTYFSLPTLDSYVYVLTDEFQDADPYVVPKDQAKKRLYISPMIFSSLDIIPDRKFSEYFPDYKSYDGYSGTINDLSFDDFNIYSYDNAIINPSTHQQLNYVRTTEIHNQTSAMMFDNDFQSTSVRDQYYERYGALCANQNLYVQNASNINSYKREGEDDRYFYPLTSKVIQMPFGRATNPDISTKDFKFRMRSRESKQEIQYLVLHFINTFGSHLYKKNEHSPLLDEIDGKHYRAAIPIPEDGFKPGCVYMITNKPGTKLFKKWDEENGTTRAGESDFIVDESCLEIEEIQL